ARCHSCALSWAQWEHFRVGRANENAREGREASRWQTAQRGSQRRHRRDRNAQRTIPFTKRIGRARQDRHFPTRSHWTDGGIFWLQWTARPDDRLLGLLWVLTA